MKIQFLNTIPIEVISGGNIYNQKIINGLEEYDAKVEYNQKQQNSAYDITIVDSLFMNKFNPELVRNQLVMALIHQIPNIGKDKIEFFKANAEFIVTSSLAKQQLSKSWNLNENKIHIIRPGIDENWSKKTDFNFQSKKILIVANFVKNKGFEMLQDVLRNLEHNNLQFFIVGNPDLDENYASSIIKRLNETNHNVSFLFNLDRNEMHQQYVDADLLLSLSLSESFGMAIFEALSLGLPCIAYKTGDYDYFSRFENYYAIEKYEVVAFLNAINNWYQNPENFHAYSTSIENVRGWQSVVNEFYSVIENNLPC